MARIGEEMLQMVHRTKEEIRLENENNLLRAKNQQLEECILELARIIGGQHGETVCTEDNE